MSTTRAPEDHGPGGPTIREGVVRSLREELFGDALNCDEVAVIMNIDRSTVMRMYRAHELPGYRIGRTWLCDPAALKHAVQLMKERSAEKVEAKHLEETDDH